MTKKTLENVPSYASLWTTQHGAPPSSSTDRRAYAWGLVVWRVLVDHFRGVPPPAAGELKLWEVQADGATFWVAAATNLDVVRLLHECWEKDGTLVDTRQADLCLDILPEKRARTRRFYDENTDARHSLWEEFQRHTQASVLACSEWP